MPIAHKDVFVTKDFVTTAGSKMLRGYRSPFDATVVRKLREAGMVTLGKLNCDEFAMGSSNENSAFGAVSNPWDTSHVPGGSSGGSAAAVAARTPEQRTNIAVTWARVVAIRTPELRAEILAKKLATRAAWTEERRASYRAKMAAVVAAHTPEQRAATEAKKAATRAKRAPEQHAVIEAKKAATRAKRAELRVLDSMIQAPCVATEPDCVAMESEQAASP